MIKEHVKYRMFSLYHVTHETSNREDYINSYHSYDALKIDAKSFAEKHLGVKLQFMTTRKLTPSKLSITYGGKGHFIVVEEDREFFPTKS